MAQLPKIAQKKKVSIQGQKSLNTWIDDKKLFSDAEDVNTETTEYELPTREENPKESDWHTWALFYNHKVKVELIKINDVIGRVDREGWILDFLEESCLKEKRDWWFDNEESCLYLADEYFLMAWKMSNCKQFEENISCVIYSTNRPTV